MKEGIRINGDDSNDENVSVDTTVQEKNITFPTDAKLHKKIIYKYAQIADKERLPVRRTVEGYRQFYAIFSQTIMILYHRLGNPGS